MAGYMRRQDGSSSVRVGRRVLCIPKLALAWVYAPFADVAFKEDPAGLIGLTVRVKTFPACLGG
jgi:hypothetical protein